MKVLTQSLRRPMSMCVVAALIAPVLQAGCGASDGPIAPVLVPASPPVQALASIAKYTLTIRDAATGALVTDSVAVTLTGVGTVNLSGVATTSFTTTNGLVSFGTAPGVVAGATLRVTTSSRAAGWTDGDAVVQVVASAAISPIDVRVTNINRVAQIAATAPIAAAASALTTAAGVSAAAITVSTPAKSVSTVGSATVTLASASVSIPAATRITNAAGQTPTGSLQLTVITPSLDTPAGQRAIPGRTSSDGTRLRISGFMSNLLTDATGARFTQFGSPITARIPIVGDARSDIGARLLAAGDKAPIYVWNPGTRRFVFRTNANVIATPTGLVAEYAKTTFSDDAVAFNDTPTPEMQRCTTKVTFTNLPELDANTDLFPPFVVSGVGSTTYDSFTENTGNSDFRTELGSISTFGLAGSQTPIGNKVFVYFRGQVFSEVVDLQCGDNTIRLATPQNPPTGSMVISTTETCPDGSNRRALAGMVSASLGTAVGLFQIYTGPSTSQPNAPVGSATIRGMPAGSYTVTGYFGANVSQPQTVTVVNGAATNVSIDQPMTCRPVTGGG